MVSADYIQQGLVQRGLPAHIAQGFVMNMRDESGLNPGINERAPIVPGSRGGYGLYQLTGPRRRAYESYASNRGVPFDSADAQLDFLMAELQGPEKRAAQSIFSTENPQDAAVAIARDFLRPATSNLQKRVASYTGGKSPQATASTQGAAPMMQQEEKPQGLLGSLGIQKMEEGAAGETGQRFFQRDSFKDTAALLAQGFGRMGIMGMEEIADDIAKQRTENKARNKTIEYLRKSGRDDLADAVESGSLGARDAAGIMFTKPKDDRTAAMQNYAEYQRIFAEQGQEAADQFRAMSGGQTFNLGDQVGAESKLREKLMAKQGENFASYLDAGAKSAAAMQDLNVLQELTPLAPSGPVVGRLAEMFPEATDISAVRQSIIKRVAPTLRVEGSGATSDLEFSAMLNSLGSLRNSPEANQAIIGVMQTKARYNMQRRKIINSYMTDDATLAETNNALAALDTNSTIPASVQSILSTYGAGGEGAGSGAPSQGAPAIGTVEGGFRFKGGNPNDKNNWEPI